MFSNLLFGPRRRPVPGRSDESFYVRGLRVDLAEIVTAIRKQMESVDYEYEPGHPHSRVAYTNPRDENDSGLVDAPDVGSLASSQRRSMMVLGPYGHVACGTEDPALMYCGSPEDQREMERLQEVLERRGRRLVHWEVMLRNLGALASILVLTGGAVILAALMPEDGPVVVPVVTVAVGLVSTALAVPPLVRGIGRLPPRPHRLVLP